MSCGHGTQSGPPPIDRVVVVVVVLGNHSSRTSREEQTKTHTACWSINKTDMLCSLKLLSIRYRAIARLDEASWGICFDATRVEAAVQRAMYETISFGGPTVICFCAEGKLGNMADD